MYIHAYMYMYILYPQNTKRMLHMALGVLQHSVRLKDKERFFIPGLWESIKIYAELKSADSPLRACSFLAFAHVYESLAAHIANNPESFQITADTFPKINRTHDDIMFTNKLWHTCNSSEEKVLGDYLARTGGAADHALLLAETVGDVSSIEMDKLMHKDSIEKIQPLLANMNNIALESQAFARQLCEAGLMGTLKAVLGHQGFDLTNLQSQVPNLNCKI